MRTLSQFVALWVAASLAACSVKSATFMLGDGQLADASQGCAMTQDCASGVCQSNVCVAASCTDGTKNSDETDVDCGGSCGPCPAGKACAVDTDCTAAGICDTKLCRVARSCAEILQHIPGSRDGVYSIASTGVAGSFSVVCDMTRDNGGWTLLLKATGDSTLSYNASAWTDGNLLNATDLTTEAGNAKYQSFLSLPVTTLRGELDGFRYTQTFANMTAQQIFSGNAAIVMDYSKFNFGAPNWSTQPYCQIFGVNTPFDYARTRFGWSANEQNDCSSNDTAIGLGLIDNASGNLHGAGYECLAGLCSAGTVDVGGIGLLWAK